LLENDFFLPILVGFALFGILTGLAVMVGRILPKWMGWVMFAFGLACLAGPAGFFGVLATMLWALVAGIWMVKQGPPLAERATLQVDQHVAAREDRTDPDAARMAGRGSPLAGGAFRCCPDHGGSDGERRHR
jgi:hypothetical protein